MLVEQILYRNFIKYENLNILNHEAFSNSQYANATNINVFINLTEALRALYKNDIQIVNQYDLVSAILNMCAHYKGYYRRYCNVEPSIFLVHSTSTVQHSQFLPEYNYSLVKMTKSNDRMTSFIESNLTMLKNVICPYIPGVYYYEVDGFEAGIGIAGIIQNNILNENSFPNIIISTAVYDYQIPVWVIGNITNVDTFIFKNKLEAPLLITPSSTIPTYIQDTRGGSKVPTDLSPELLSLLMAFTNLPSRNIKSKLNINKAISLIRQAIREYIIKNQYVPPVYSVVRDICMLGPNINETEILNRFRAIDFDYIYSIYKMFKIDTSYYIDLYDPKGVQAINDKYFKDHPIDLNRL